MSALYLESFRPNLFCPLSQVCIENVPVLMTTELNNLRKNVNYIEIKNLTNKVRWENTTRLGTVTYENKLKGWNV